MYGPYGLLGSGFRVLSSGSGFGDLLGSTKAGLGAEPET